ncbi:MAG: peptidoglycan editing factor PgeF [Calditrichaeota bacterium]|nr:peptidoglycan editing factor PgeF [Calditrichota bacterium]
MEIKPLIKRFDIFKPFPRIIHGFSTRKGGVSNPPFDQCNLGLRTGDLPSAVEQNRRLFFTELGVPQQQIVFPEQVHSDRIKIVDAPGIVPQCDALITARPGLFLSVQTADCFPVFIYDDQNEAAAIVHSGWRGSAKNIVGKTVSLLKTRFHSSPENLFVAVGPGVQKQCYQIDPETARYFPESFLSPDGADHFKLNLQGVILRQLADEGIPEANIEYDSDCTHCNAELYYSYRRDGNKSGRMMGVIGIRQKT